MTGEIIFYVYSVGPDGLTGCIGFPTYAQAEKHALKLKRPCCIRTFKCIDETVISCLHQESIFDKE